MFHSINQVDEFLDTKLPAFGYAVDVGANDGTFYSNSLHFEEKGWMVMCVEANPLLEPALRSNRKLCRMVACGSQNGELDFVAIGVHPYPSGSGFHTQRARELFDLPQEEQTFRVPVVTLNDILTCSGFPRLDYLTVDVEDHENEVLNGIDLSVWKPKFIVAESWGGSETTEYHAKIIGSGYKCICRMGFDNIYERH